MTTKIAFNQIDGASINAADYGVVNDGSDIGAKLNLAAVAANTAKATLIIPEGQLYTSSVSLDWSGLRDLEVEGAGWRNTQITFTTDVIGIVFEGNRLEGIRVDGIGASATQSGIIYSGNRRKYVQRVHAEGFYDGQVYDEGNHSYFNMIACVTNVNHGFVCTNTSTDKNGTTVGMMDLRNNGGDGLHMVDDAAQINRCQMLSGGIISTTLNAGKAANITGRGHNLIIYEETNTTSSVDLIANSEGCQVTMLLGGAVDNSSAQTNNIIFARQDSVETWIHSNLQSISNELNNRDYNGRLKTTVTADREYTHSGLGSTSSFKTRFVHGTGDSVHSIEADGLITSGVGFVFPSYTVATLPSAGTAGRSVYVTDEVGGATLAFADGTNWRRVQDRVIAS